MHIIRQRLLEFIGKGFLRYTSERPSLNSTSWMNCSLFFGMYLGRTRIISAHLQENVFYGSPNRLIKNATTQTKTEHSSGPSQQNDAVLPVLRFPLRFIFILEISIPGRMVFILQWGLDRKLWYCAPCIAIAYPSPSLHIAQTLHTNCLLIYFTPNSAAVRLCFLDFLPHIPPRCLTNMATE